MVYDISKMTSGEYMDQCYSTTSMAPHDTTWDMCRRTTEDIYSNIYAYREMYTYIHTYVHTYIRCVHKHT